jgi:hypothetical protein
MSRYQFGRRGHQNPVDQERNSRHAHCSARGGIGSLHRFYQSTNLRLDRLGTLHRDLSSLRQTHITVSTALEQAHAKSCLDRPQSTGNRGRVNSQLPRRRGV